MNLLEQFLINQQNKEQPYNQQPLVSPEQLTQQQKLAESLQQPGSIMRGISNLLIHPGNALFGAKSQQQEMPTTYDPLVGVDMPVSDYQNAEKQGLLPSQLGMITSGVADNPRQGGLLRDFASGFNENLNNRFNVNNLETDKNKGFANKFGEALGTGTRILDSPIGRFALTAGVVGATGGSGLQALGYGATAGVGNQKLRTQDKMYRNALKQQGVDTSDISGYIDGDMYKNYTMGVYRNRSLDIREQLGLLGDNTKRAGLIRNLLNSGNITPEEAQIRMAEYGITAEDLAVSNQTRNADVNQYLAPAKKYAYETAPQVAIGNFALNQMKADPNYQAIVEEAKEIGKINAGNKEEYNDYVSTMPELKKQVDRLNELSKTATYTIAGVAKDSITRQMGLPVGKGAIARTEYMAVIDNQVLPLLKKTFGAQMTVIEGDRLRATLGDVTKSPAEKQAVLNAFIRQKEMNIQSQARKVQQYSGSVPRSQPKSTSGVTKSGIKWKVVE